jgi:hypothetical protein
MYSEDERRGPLRVPHDDLLSEHSPFLRAHPLRERERGGREPEDLVTSQCAVA